MAGTNCTIVLQGVGGSYFLDEVKQALSDCATGGLLSGQRSTEESVEASGGCVVVYRAVPETDGLEDVVRRLKPFIAHLDHCRTALVSLSRAGKVERTIIEVPLIDAERKKLRAMPACSATAVDVLKAKAKALVAQR